MLRLEQLHKDPVSVARHWAVGGRSHTLRMALSTCPSGKARYRDRVAALLALAGAQRTDGSRRAKIEKRAYACPDCRGWHLTSRRRR